MKENTVGSYIMSERGINNIDIVDTNGNLLSTSCSAYDRLSEYYDRPIKSAIVQDRGNFGFVATLTV